MDSKFFIDEAVLFLEKRDGNLLPDISSPIVAKFAENVISNNLVMSREEISAQAKIFLHEEELEEVFHCEEALIEIMADFVLKHSMNPSAKPNLTVNCGAGNKVYK